MPTTALSFDPTLKEDHPLNPSTHAQNSTHTSVRPLLPTPPMLSPPNSSGTQEKKKPLHRRTPQRSKTPLPSPRIPRKLLPAPAQRPIPSRGSVSAAVSKMSLRKQQCLLANFIAGDLSTNGKQALGFPLNHGDAPAKNSQNGSSMTCFDG